MPLVRGVLTGLDQDVFNVQPLARLIRHVLAAGLTLAAGKQAIGGLLANVSQHLGDPDWASAVQRLQKGPCVGRHLAAPDLRKYPALGWVDDHDQIAMLALTGHLGQVLDVHMHVAKLIKFEAPGSFLGLLGQQGLEIAHAMTTQTVIQARAGNINEEKFAGDCQQNIERQQQGFAQLHRYQLLGATQDGLQAMGGVRSIGEDLGAADGTVADVVARRQSDNAVASGGDLDAGGGSGADVLV